jgi:hypothetical protein
MPTPRIFAILAILALALPLGAQTPPPTAYTITESITSPPFGSTMTIYRSGSKVLADIFRPADSASPASHTLNLIDIDAGKSWTWDPEAKPITCSAARFSGGFGDGDPYAMTDDLRKSIAKGELKPAGTEVVAGIPANIYSGIANGIAIKAWFDEKGGLVLRTMIGAPGAALQPLIDIKKISLTPPAPSLFTPPSACASVTPPPTPEEVIASETGDSAANWVNAIHGPGSKNSCSILIHVVHAGTMAPLNRRYQVAIDTTYNQNDPTPPSYEFGVGNDGTATYKGGGLHEISNQVHNGLLRIDNPPAYFNLSMNVVTPGHGAGMSLIYRQCFAPVTNLYYVVSDPEDSTKLADWLYAKSGKYAAQ